LLSSSAVRTALFCSVSQDRSCTATCQEITAAQITVTGITLMTSHGMTHLLLFVGLVDKLFLQLQKRLLVPLIQLIHMFRRRLSAC